MSVLIDRKPGDAEPAAVVSYVHSLLRLYEAAAQCGVGEGERLLDFSQVQPLPPAAAMLKTRRDAIGFAVACVGEVLVRENGPQVLHDITQQIEARYGWTAGALLRQLWAGVCA